MHFDNFFNTKMNNFSAQVTLGRFFNDTVICTDRLKCVQLSNDCFYFHLCFGSAMYEIYFHKTAILTFFNEHKIDKFYNFETLYHNTIPFSNVFEEKNPYLYLNISY